ncbi:MAG: bis(5'-nucleosyl)-tetraphosphatase (symmetrical) YqeK [Candidatus Izemoplasmatales bacterium]
MNISALKEIVDTAFVHHPSRRIHTYSVAKLAQVLAHIYHVEEEKAIYASYAHDLTKYWTEEEAILLIESMNPSEDISSWGKFALHALSGAYYIKKLGVNDDDIFNAIKYHTTGRKEMSKLEQIIYISDYCEETRPFDSSSILKEALVSLDKAMYMIIQSEVLRHLEKHHLVMELTTEALLYYQKIVEEMK